MKGSNRIVAGGGWIYRNATGRPKARLFGLLSLGWFFISIPASAPLWIGTGDPSSAKILGAAMILPHPLLALLGLYFLLTEKPRELTVKRRNPDYDPHNLY